LASTDTRYEPRAKTVTDWVRNQILEGHQKPGERIRQEAVAEACGTSRIPVREAFNQLKNEGLITLTSHVGARVARLDLAELDEIYMLREQLEPFALAKSVPHLTEDDHSALGEYVGEIEASADPANPSRWVELDRVFHLRALSAAQLPRFHELIEEFWNRSQQYRRAYTRLPETFEVAHAEHRLLMDAIVRRDAADAEAILRVHIRRTRQALDQHADLFDEPEPQPRGRRG
jgi:DNA-binding GntR family transcriptional regulator